MSVSARCAAAFLGALAGAALFSLPGWAGMAAVWAGVAAGAACGWFLAPAQPAPAHWLERAAPLALAAFFVPMFTMAVPPGADMAMHTALARGLVEGRLSPAWGELHLSAYPRGFSALLALAAPLAGYARAGLAISALSYLVFWAGLAAVFSGPLQLPWPRTAAVIALFLSRAPQWFFAWGGNPTALALGFALLAAAALDRAGLRAAVWAALLLAAAVATHPMGACAGGLAAAVFALRRRAWLPGGIAAFGLVATLAAVTVFGPHVSPREWDWIRDCARNQERAGTGVLGDAANIVTIASVVWLLWKKQFRPVAIAAGTVAALFVLFAALPFAGLYPGRFAPLLLLAVVPLWTSHKWILAAAALAAVPGHLHWYQRSEPIAQRADVENIACVARTVPPDAVIDGAYGDATQWIPALTGLAVTRPHQHVALFDETDAALAKLPPAHFRFVGRQERYPPHIDPPAGTPIGCNGSLYTK